MATTGIHSARIPNHLGSKSRAPHRASHGWIALIAALTLILAVLVPAAPAGAVQRGNQSTVVSADAARWTPHVLDGYVSGFAETGGLVVAVGNFSSVRSAVDETPIARTNIFAFKNNTGEITALNVAVNGEIMDVLAVGDGQNVWISGSFSQVNGSKARSIAKINVFTGALDVSFAAPAFDGRINQLLLRGDRLYVTGRFLTVGTTATTYLSALNPSTGAVFADVRMDINTPRTTQTDASIQRADITPDGRRLVAIGNFTIVNGQTRAMIFTADLTTSPPTLTNWSTDRFTADCSQQFDSQMRDVDISPDGSYFVVGTTGGPHPGKLCDTASRWELGTEAPQSQPTWVNYTGGDTITRVAVTQTAVYLGGHFRWLNNPAGSNSMGPGAVVRTGLAAIDPRDGMPTTWNPTRARGYGVYSFVATDSGLWIGSDTDRISNSQYHGRLAFMPIKGGFAMPADDAGRLPTSVFSAGAAKDDRGAALPGTALIRREFSGTEVTSSSIVPSAQDWALVRGLFMVDGVLYSARSDGTFQQQTFDGAALGTPTVINLNGLIDFPTELGTMTGLFYDRATARIYYTLAGNNNLYYRYFETQSGIPGATRFTASASLPGLTFSDARSMFLDGTQLYVASSTGGLSRWDWNPGSGAPVAGSGIVVSGPALDGVNWTARDTFVFAGSALVAPAAAAANQPPSAAFSTAATDLELKVDGNGSSDPDGPIKSYAWSFGDDSTADGPTASHIYQAAGRYTVSLTVTDFHNASGTTSKTFTMTAPPAAGLAFRAAAQTNANSMVPSVTVPSSVQAGDGTLLFVTVGDAASTVGPPSGPGWRLVASKSGSTMQTQLWARTAQAADAGSVVQVPISTLAKSAVQLLAYSGVTGPAWVDAAVPVIDGTTASVRTTPKVTAGFSGSTLVSYWANKSSADNGWSADPSVGVRSQTTGTGSGRITSLVGDTAPVGAGVRGQVTATPLATPDTKSAMWSVILNAGSMQTPPLAANQAPSPFFTAAAADLTVQVDASGSSDPDGSITDYAWSFGDGSTATGATRTHVYSATGRYTITLTVTDNAGASGTTSKVVTVTAPPAAAPVFRAAAQTNANSMVPSVTVPSSVQAGDGTLLFVTVGDAASTVGPPSGPGWRLVASKSGSTMQTQLWARTAQAADAGSVVQVPISTLAKSAVQLLAYSGVTGPAWVDAAVPVIDGTTASVRTTPKVTAGFSGSTLVSYWANKSSADNGWSADPSVGVRSQTTGTGSGRITSLVGDTAPVGAGVRGQVTATPLATPDTKSAMWSVILNAGS